MKRFFSCSSSQVAVERWNRRDQKLLEAVQRGDVGRVAALASRKSARPSKLDSNGQSPFHLAASKGLTECLSVLLANGADINSKNEDGSTALHLATISCQPQCVKILLQHGANEDAVDAENRSPLHWAASSGCASSVLLLCDHEAFLDVLDNDGRTPLMIASLGGHAAICSQLLQRGARVNVTDKDDKSALILACEKGSAEVAELLLSHGADAGAVDSRGHDALHYALCTQDKTLWRLLQQALNRRRRGGQRLVQHPDLASQASSSEPHVGSPLKSPWRAEPEEEQKEEEDEDPCSKEWKWKYEEEQKKVSQLEQDLVRKTEECKAQAAAFLGLESQIREQVQELGLLLSQEPRAPRGHGSRLRPGGDGMEQGCPLDLLAEHIQELKKQQQAAAIVNQEAKRVEENSAAGEIQHEVHGKSPPEEQGPPQSPRSEATRKSTEQQLTGGPHTLVPDHTGQQPADQKARPQASGVEATDAVAEPVDTAAMNHLLLQLREELAAVWRDKDAARGALSRPVLEGALGTPRAEAAAAAWEKMEARLERVLVRLDRAKAGLQGKPEVPGQESRAGAPKAAPGCIKEHGEEELAPGARGEPLGAPGEQFPGGGLPKGQLEKEVSALRLSNNNLLEELRELGCERQRLQGELQSLSQRLRGEFVPKLEAQVQLHQLQRSVGLLTEELAMEKEATEKLRKRLASQSSGLRGLWDCLPPDLVGTGRARSAEAEPLAELRACITALADRQREAQRALAGLEEENRRLRASLALGGEPAAFSKAPASPQVAALEQDLGKLEEELRAVQAAMSGKSQEMAKLKQLLYQATEEVAELRAQEAASLRQHEKTRLLVAQAQAWGQELKDVLEKYNAACREMGRLREAAAEERRRSDDLAARAAEQERRASELRGRSEEFEKTAEGLKEKTERLMEACRDKKAKIKELLKKLEQLSEEVLSVRGENARLALELQDSQKSNEEIITTYRNHLLSAAQGYMEQDVYNVLLRILSMQEE
ncbi:ankyrin repeat domain-containing protein 35 [Heterocephalus glaber]|uniref:Ankyrin repeat domain-containing protein 35 n=1 Tax=Heterocephalus glaber TaxID=10181 RepID=A0AAX6TKG7_HETGA|nr:ankyrin repeat domain-containing protein 35 [Heterocephalus glaber]XP_021121471.1 ankyrin repeat domain-containing protein 35 [Heterocephalus glaber]XP_021121472.1 ankyrin repeat domain-containing protein 35 [Heterocephalus glaber]XP_021121473.1 ankyrin repeat domain-containing protein 35 [Heterocephalus glaber]